MATTQQIRKDTWDIFTDHQKNAPRSRAVAAAPVGAASTVRTDGAVTQFSEFDEGHIERAKAIWTELFRIANGNFEGPGTGKPKQEKENELIAKALKYYKSIDENADLKQYALMVFITHNERAKRVLHGTIPGISSRKPLKMIPSMVKMQQVSMADTTATGNIAKGGNTDEAENRMNYFREDPLFNEHHEHWHVVYPNGGIPVTDNEGNVTYQERQRHGEMFVYMHQQMLAHYEANRLAVGLPEVVPFDFSTRVEVGYDPGTFVQEFGDISYSARPANWEIVSTSKYSVTQHIAFLKRLSAVMKQGYITANGKKIKLTADLIGMLLESLGGQVEQFGDVKNYYGNVHNKGHMLLSNAPGGGAPYGVMSATATAVRDQVFFRWHRNIDNYSFTWQETQRPVDFADGPNVLIRNGFDYSPDIIICSLQDIATIGKEFKLSSEQVGMKGFGGDNWNTDFTDGFTVLHKKKGDSGTALATVSTIQNYLSEGKIIINPDGQGSSAEVPYEYLNHDQYGFFIRLENLMPVTSKVTVRMFMVAKEFAENRRMWIELDKFTHVLQPNSRDVIFRRDLDSAIIRKPAITDPAVHNLIYRPLSMTDMEDTFAGGLSGYMDTLNGYLHGTGDPVNSPSLVDFYNRYIGKDADAENTPEDVRKAAFKSILDKYFNNLTIGWEEILKIKNPGFEHQAIDTNKLFIVVTHEQVSGDVVAYYNALIAFITSQLSLLAPFKVTLLAELTAALLKAFQRVHDIAFCECGLPYNILYPRGTEEGTDYYLMVMLTDWNKDISSYENCCGSMSYCGTKGTYPDIREMGYPFNRPFNGGILDTFAGMENVAIRSFKMKLVNKK